MTINGKGLKDKRTCRIFFSSPFGGMEDEREELTRQYFPRIHHLCASRGVQFVAVDMRWGITTEASSSAQVINICLRELDRSDMFVGFFGQRYGWFGAEDKALQENFDNAVQTYPWLDKFRDKSVTELEFLHGHLNNPGDLPAVICFRDKAYDDMRRKKGQDRGDKKEVFKYSAESELSTQLMDDLKKRVQDTADKTLGVHMKYSTPAEGAELMFNAIWKHLNEVLLKDTVQESKFSRIKSEHQAFLSRNSLLYVGNEDILQKLTDNINTEDPVQYVITGPSGCGKSALLSTFLKHLMSERFSDICVVYHFVGAAEESTNIKRMLLRIIKELETQAGLRLKENKYEELKMAELVNQLVVAFEKVLSIGKYPVLVVDGVDKIKKSTKVEKAMFWLPAQLPKGVRIIVSTKSSDDLNVTELVNERKYHQIIIPPLTKQCQKELSEKVLMQSGKELSPHQLQKIVDADVTENLMFLKSTLHELVVFGYFRLLDKKIESLISSENVVDLFDKVLQRLEEDYNVKEYTDNLVEQCMCSIVSSRHGLSEQDIRTIHNIPAHVWSPLYFALQNYIIEQNGLIRFTSIELKQAVEKRYFKEEGKRDKYIRAVISHFEKAYEKIPKNFTEETVLNERYALEIPWLYVRLNDMTGLQKSLLDLRTFHILNKENLYDMIELWEKTRVPWDDIGKMYMKQIDLILIDYLQYTQDNFIDHVTPSIMLINSGLLKNIAEMLVNVSPYAGTELIERSTKITLHAIETKPQMFKERDADRSLYYMACQYCDSTNYEKSEELHQKVLESRKRRYEKDPSEDNLFEYGQSYHGLAVLYQKTRHPKKAEEYFLKSKELQDQTRGQELNMDTSALLQNLGVVCLDQGRHEESLTYFQECLRMQEKIYFGHLPESIGQLVTNIGLCYRRMGNLEEAEKMYKKSLDIKINAVGYYTLDVAKSFMNLGTLETARGDSKMALQYANNALEIFQRCGVREHDIEYMMTKENIILAYINVEMKEEAVEAYKSFFKMAVDHDLLRNTFSHTHLSIAQCLMEKEQYEEAENILVTLLEAKDNLSPGYFYRLHLLDKITGGKNRKPEHKIEKGFELFPNDSYIIEAMVKDIYVPQQETEKLVDLLETRQSIFGAGRLYDAANSWFNETNVGTYPMLIEINLSALKFVPDNVMFTKNVAVGYLQTKDYNNALIYYTKALAMEEDDPQTHFRVAQCSCLVGQFDLSKEQCQIIKEKFPNEENLLSQVDNILKCISDVEKDQGETKESEENDQGKTNEAEESDQGKTNGVEEKPME